MDATTGTLIFFAFLFFLTPVIKFLRFLWHRIITPCQIDLKRKFGDWAVVTGSTDGIGKEYAKELAKRDINVILISRSQDKLNKTENEIRLLNPHIQVKTIQADFSRGKDEFEKIKTGLKDISIGILVNNVGKLSEYPMYFGEIPESEIWDMINLNVGATTLMIRLVIGQMKERGKGAIVNLCSATADMPLPLMSFYAATKTLVRYFSDAIRAEYSEHGLVIQTLSPFYINTKLVSYSKMVKEHQIIFPSATTYAKSAINTLGKIDSTAGYWIHDLATLAYSIIPIWLGTSISFIFTKRERKCYLKSRDKMNP